MQRHRLPTIAITVLVLWTGCDRKMPKAVISGGSMYPSLPGEHYKVECNDCRWEFLFDSFNPPKSGEAVCPNCGYAKINFANTNIQPPSRPTLSAISAPLNRWDVVAFEDPKENSRYLVKRLVGLPGENLTARNGNLYCDDTLLRKPYAVFSLVRQIVFDSNFTPDQHAQRLNVQNTNSNWNFESNVWRFDVKNPTETPDLLIYKNIRGYRHFGERSEVAAIEDSSGFNQNISRDLYPVSDVQVETIISKTPAAVFFIRVSNSQEIDVVLDGQELRATVNGLQLNQTTRVDLSDRDATLSVAAYDEQLMVGINGKVLFFEPIPLGSGPTTISFGASNGNIQLKSFRIFRDVHYLPMAGSETGNGFFVLGDNPPVSVDSRMFGTIQAAKIIGLVQLN